MVLLAEPQEHCKYVHSALGNLKMLSTHNFFVVSSGIRPMASALNFAFLMLTLRKITGESRRAILLPRRYHLGFDNFFGPARWIARNRSLSRPSPRDRQNPSDNEDQVVYDHRC
jgi:hypothetical protein